MSGNSEENMEQDQGDTPDAKFFSSGRHTKPVAAVKPIADSGATPLDTSFQYTMHHPRRGMCVIINNRTFAPRTGMSDRSGSDKDAANLYECFKALGFEIYIYNDQTTTAMLRLMTEAARENHADADCFAAALLSHGDKDEVYGTDATIKLELLIEPFKGCPSLLGKPKLFFIQASDAGPPAPRSIPVEADFLLAYSTVPGYYSWRNSTRGSWFIQALCKVLSEHGTDREIMWLMTRVNYIVAYEFESNAAQAHMHKKKQIPCITSMLTKELHFLPKKS